MSSFVPDWPMHCGNLLDTCQVYVKLWRPSLSLGIRMKKLRVLTVSKPYVSAAYRQKLRLLADDPRFEIGLITCEDWAGQKYESFPSEGYWIKQLAISFNGKNHFFFFHGLEQAIREFAPDVINIEEEHYSLVTYQVMRIARRIGAKCLFYTWQNIKKTYPPPFSWIEKYVFRHTAVAVAGNQEALDILRDKGYRGQAEIIPQMGADAEAIDKVAGTKNDFRRQVRTQYKIPDSALTLVFAGRLVEEKGVQDDLKAIALLKAEGREIHFLILGDGPYREALRDLANSLGISSHVHFVGSVPSLQIYQYLGVGDALILSSHTRNNWKEQFGRILIEGMLTGVVPIGSSSGEIPLVIADAGLVHKEQDVADIARAIRTLDLDRDILDKLASKAVDRVRENFTNSIVAQKFGSAFLRAANLKS